jgi:chaperonin GroES
MCAQLRWVTGCCSTPEDKAEVEVRGDSYVLLRERDLHAVAAERIEGGQTGLYL